MTPLIALIVIHMVSCVIALAVLQQFHSANQVRMHLFTLLRDSRPHFRRQFTLAALYVMTILFILGCSMTLYPVLF